MTREEARKHIMLWVYSLDDIPPKHVVEALTMAADALRPISREQVEEMWRSEWEDMRETYKDVPKYRCAQCRGVFIGIETSFCPACGAPMTDEAVQMVMERLEALRCETETD